MKASKVHALWAPLSPFGWDWNLGLRCRSHIRLWLFLNFTALSSCLQSQGSWWSWNLWVVPISPDLTLQQLFRVYFPEAFSKCSAQRKEHGPEQNFYFSTTVTSNISGFSACFGENIKCYNVVFIPMLQIWVHSSVSQLSSLTKQEIKKRSDQKGLLNIWLILYTLFLWPGRW